MLEKLPISLGASTSTFKNCGTEAPTASILTLYLNTKKIPKKKYLSFSLHFKTNLKLKRMHSLREILFHKLKVSWLYENSKQNKF